MQAPHRSELDAWLALNLVKGVGPRLQVLLLERFGSPRAVLAARPEELAEVSGIGRKILEELRQQNHLDQARRELAECAELGITLLTRDAATYPATLREIADPPLLLYQQGALIEQDQLAVAVVGSRNCTMYGRRMAEKIATGLSLAGMTIISGLARGIDAVAHQAALKAGGRTIAVCASGLKQIYPPEHLNLAADIARNGAVISESPLHRQPTRGLFPQRNRIVSGMSLGVIVIEASSTSGTLHTARHAMEQGREVFALPGPIDSRESEGCHALIRDGVKLVRGVDDILEDLGPLMQPIQMDRRARPNQSEVHGSASPTIELRSPLELNLSDQQSAILNLLHDQPVSIDAVIEQSGIEPSRVLSTLTILEMKRLVQRLPGNQLLRIPR